MGKKACLTYRDNEGDDKTLELDGEVFRIGRLVDNDLLIDNPYVSRYHAEITLEGSAYRLRDLDSTSGTFVNDLRIEEHRLKDGDRIRLGQAHGVELVFNSADREVITSEDEAPFQPVRVLTLEQARFIHTEMLPPTPDLPDATVERLRGLYEFTSELHAASSPQDLSDRLVTFLHRVFKAERCAVLLYDRERDSLLTAATYPSDVDRDVTPSLTIARQILQDNVAMLSIDASKDARFLEHESVRFQSIRSVMCAPMGSKTRVWGVCYVDNLTSDRVFDDEELDFLTAVARQVGLTMENLYLLDEQRRSLESFIRTLSASIGARDDWTAGHSARVGAYASGIARTMGMDPAACRAIYYAGLLHDYGKIGTRDDVLLKPAELTPEEYEHVKEHPLHTFRILSKIRFPEDLSGIPMVAAAHHERWDGSGYPHGLKGEEIPLGSRIVAVADAYDAVSEERVYHDPVAPEAALSEITMRSGTYFDPVVVEAFVQYFNREIAPRRLQKSEPMEVGS